MKYIVLTLIMPFLVGCTPDTTKDNNTSKKFWTIEKAKAHLKDRQDSTTWDSIMFYNDLLSFVPETSLPLMNGVFPNPHYALMGKGSFSGVGNFGFPGGDGLEKKIGSKTILYNSFFVGASEVNRAFIGDKKNEVFFQIIVLVDFVDTMNYTHLSSEIVSRNHPDYIGQGFYKTQNNRIDYLAFNTADLNAYAIVNMRLFDLNLGETILIAPQKDNSFRSMQIKSPQLSSDEVDAYTDELLRQEEVIDFFTYVGNI